VIGASLNALGILLGGLYGLAVRKPLSAAAQVFFKSALVAFTVLFGLRLIWENLHGTVGTGIKQLGIAALALILGRLLGKALRLQRLSNHLGRHAANLIAAAQKPNAPNRSGGLTAATILFCAAPLGILGAVADGLGNYYYLLAVKAVMEGLAMASFAKIFRWPVILSAAPVFLFLTGLTGAVQVQALPWLEAHHLVAAINLVIGMLTCTLSLVILEIRRVELANYLPALALAPVLAAWLM
jgi:uncharacterized protein